MKLSIRAKLAMLGGALAAATLAGLIAAAPPGHAAALERAPAAQALAASAVTLTPASQPKGPSTTLGCSPTGCTLPLGIPTLYIYERQSCRELIIWGWNYTDGGNVDISLYDGVHYLTSARVTAADGYYPGQIQWIYILPGPGTGHHFLATGYDEASRWMVSATLQC